MSAEIRPGRPDVLLVDDDPEVLAGLRLSLRRLPVSVLTASSGAEALAILEQRPVWMIISDERMPEMSGSELLGEVYRRWPEVTRVILSGQASMESVISAINEARIFRFLTKPTSPEELSHTVLQGLAVRDDVVAEQRRRTDDHTLDEQLDEALEHLWVALQPITDAHGGGVVAFEALMRSEHEALRTPPAVLDAAARLGRQFDVDRTVRSRVAAHLPLLPEDVRVFVNLMPDSLADPLLTSDADPLAPWSQRLVWEITERAGLEGIPNLDDRLVALRSRGARIALDDLGAGYAGLNSFAELSPDIVKFDMELIRDIDRSPTRSKLVGSMVRLCRDLDIRTVAEGIETETERETVVALGCDLLQGYLLGRPSPIDTWVGARG